LVSLTCFWSCEKVTEYNSSFGISGLVIPEYEDDIWGTDVTIEGKGFLSGDRLILRLLIKPLSGSPDQEVEIKEITSSHLKFLFPVDALESGYSLILVRGDKEISLGSMQQWAPKGWVEDVTLRNILKVLGSRLFDARDSVKLDVAKDFEFQDATLHIEGRGITSLNGLEHFPKLKTLWATDNHLDDVDLSKMDNLQGLFAWNSQITGLKFGGALKKEFMILYAGSNPLTELDLSNCPALTTVVMDNCPFRKLSIVNNMCVDFGNFKFNFDPTVPAAECELKVSEVWFWEREIYRNNGDPPVRAAGLSGVKVSTIGFDEEVVIDKVNWTSLTDETRTTVPMPDGTLRNIMKGYCPAAFDASDNVIISVARIASLGSIGNTLDLTGKGITSLEGLKYFDDLWYLVCDNNPDLREIDLLGWHELTTLSAQHTGLTEFVVTGLKWLKDIDLSNNPDLTKIDLRGVSRSSAVIRFKATNCPKLTYLDLRNGYTKSNWGTTQVDMDFDFAANGARTLKVETGQRGGWAGRWNGLGNPVQKAINAGVNVEYYDWWYAAERPGDGLGGHYGERRDD
jgi:hypothetical protein